VCHGGLRICRVCFGFACVRYKDVSLLGRKVKCSACALDALIRCFPKGGCARHFLQSEEEAEVGGSLNQSNQVLKLPN